MSNLLLRKLTRKSNIGFGDFKDWSVGQMMDLGKQKELLTMYYGLSKIDFCDELKAELRMDEKTIIRKPGRGYGLFDYRIGKVLSNYYNSLGEKEIDIVRKERMKEYNRNKKYNVRANILVSAKQNSRMLNRNRNQKS